MEQQTTEHHYRSERDRFERNGASGSPEWMKHLRRTAFDAFAHQGFPGTDKEEWRFTNIAPIAKTEFSYAAVSSSAVTQSDLDQFGITEDEHQFVFVNGHFTPHLSTAEIPSGMTAFAFAQADAAGQQLMKQHLAQRIDMNHNAFAALNTAFVADGLFIQLDSQAAVAAPIHIMNIATGTDEGAPSASYPRVIIDAGEHSSATIVETFAARDNGTYFTNAVTEMLLQTGANIHYVKLEVESESAYHMHSISVEQRAESVLNMFSLALGGSISRSDVSVLLEGEKSDCNVNGLYIAEGSRLTDHHTFIHHKQPECTSHELFKGILDGNARGVYSGKVYVDAIAQKTDSKQTNRNLMLSETATIDT
ncbi:MAG TPA: SufD family Fe-S cluster assembly protein, partial [Bacteroidota bacterium]|nr:SufD family Fe-S cluster assembly protein [Bacteroidota bacterium]